MYDCISLSSRFIAVLEPAIENSESILNSHVLQPLNNIFLPIRRKIQYSVLAPYSSGTTPPPSLIRDPKCTFLRTQMIYL